MKTFFYNIISLILIASVLPSCTRAAPAWQAEFEKGQAALSSSDYANAIRYIESSIEKAEKEGVAKKDLTAEFACLSKCYLAIGNKEKARQLTDQSIAQPGLDKDSIKLIPLLNASYDLAYREKNFDLASQTAQRSLEIQKKAKSPNDSQLIETYNQLIAALCVGGKCSDIAPLLQEQLEVRRRSLGADHPHVAVSLSLLGENAEKKRDYEKALKYYEEALAIRKKTDPSLIAQSEKNVLRVHQKTIDRER